GEDRAVVFPGGGAGTASAPSALPVVGSALFLDAGSLFLSRAAVLQTNGRWRSPSWSDVVLVGPGQDVTFAEPVDGERIGALARALSATFALGVASSLLDAAVAHARDRVQFGVPIGTQQAVKHSLADAWIDLAHARALVAGGVRQLDAGDVGAHRVVAMGKDKAGRATQRSAERCLQVFGGIGFTWEHRTHDALKTVARLRHYPATAAALRAELLSASTRAY
uniref:acyl-CoA dehydrogenase family protein n=1 Tax=Sporichthya sp. TaxID=65475 RepID=UPI0017D77851